MGNQIFRPLTSTTILNFINNKLNNISERTYAPDLNALRDADLVDSKIVIIDEVTLATYNRKYELSFPTSHLKRLIAIWFLAPLPDIAKHLWKIYLDILPPKLNTCYVCCDPHHYLECKRYIKCQWCDAMGHSQLRCPQRCACGKRHMVEDHLCQICKMKGHIETKCSNICLCGMIHSKLMHICSVCNKRGHMEQKCKFLCKCGSYSHAYYNHKCRLCGEKKHLEDNCPDGCTCGLLHLLGDHICEKCGGSGHVEMFCIS